MPDTIPSVKNNFETFYFGEPAYSWHPDTRHIGQNEYYAPGWVGVPNATLGELQSKILTNCWSPIIFKDGQRRGANFLYADLGGLDFDETHDINDIARRLCDIVSIIGTTQRHSEAAHRFRFIFKWARRIADLNEYVYNLGKMRQQYDLISDEHAMDGARLFKPCREIRQIVDEGYLVDVHPLPEDYLTPKQKALRELERQQSYAEQGVLDSYVRRDLKYGVEDGKRNYACFATAKKLTMWGMDEAKIEELILKSPIPKTDYHSQRSAQRAIRSGIRTARRVTENQR